MPQLNGIVIANGERAALFRNPDDLTTATLREGESMDGFEVAAITRDWVELRCGTETYHAAPVPDPGYRAAMTALRPSAADFQQQAQADNDK